ncbi:MAG: YhjD/YihY/BrkB family envelope integrity protein [Pseudomonadota bacterium]
MTHPADPADVNPDDIRRPHLRAATRRAVRRLGTHGIPQQAGAAAFFLGIAVLLAVLSAVGIAGLWLAPDDITRGPLFADTTTDLVLARLRDVAAAQDATLTNGAVLGLTLAFILAALGTQVVIGALNLAYGQADTRGTAARLAAVVSLTLILLILLGLQLTVVMVPPVLLALIDDLPFWETIIATARWPLFLFIAVATLVLTYRIGPCPRAARTRVIAPGHVMAAAVWALGTAAFALLVEQMASINEVFALILTSITLFGWLWLSVFAVLLCVE